MIRSILFPVLFSCALISVQACTTDDYEIGEKQQALKTELVEPINLTITVRPVIQSDTTVNYTFNGRPMEVIIKFPSDTAFKGTIVALPGWNYDNNEWCDKTELCEKALAKGYALILPEMGKSIYCDSIFPETRKDWLKYPTRSWIKETMIPNIQNDFQLLVDSQDNFVMGLSTGARGAVLLAMDLPEIFSACGALSGDFDQTRYTKDNLYNGYYGPYLEFTDRWTTQDNAVTSIAKLTVPVYLAHGDKDAIVPIEYSNQLFIALQESGNEASILNVNPTAGHDYDFWNSEVDAVLDFFKKHGN
ncbi:MAG: prolyl oligopeptidase family serine peptidase [Crocinitomicaceae bacterium]|nr:prolyl oligopeptidase family serine peptidase [Crocinitomicaceae bacterium]